jgi:hypothetical protein
MKITFITTDIAGFLTKGEYKTMSGAIRFAKKTLRNYIAQQQSLGKTDAENIKMELWIGDNHRYFSPEAKPDFTVNSN